MQAFGFAIHDFGFLGFLMQPAPPERVVGFGLPDILEQALMAFGYLDRAASFLASDPSLLFSSGVSFPNRVFRRVFSLLCSRGSCFHGGVYI